jgi:hypothetical protein
MYIDRRYFCVELCTMLACMKCAAQPPESSTERDAIRMPSERADDSYAIFSLLIPSLQNTKKEYLVADTTEDPSRQAFTQTPIARSEVPQSPITRALKGIEGIVVDVPERRLTQFHQVQEDYASRKGERLRLEPKFNMPLPYQLMDSKLMAEYERREPALGLVTQTWQVDRKIARHYRGRGPLSRMSEVYFDRFRTLGLVWAVKADDCLLNWYAFEKQDGRWTAASWKGLGMCVQA